MVAAAMWASPNAAGAGPPTDTLREFFAAGGRILMDPTVRDDPEAALAAARRLVHTVFDVREASAQVLGREWAARTPAEQTEFVRLFADLMERAYLAQVVARLHGEDGVRVDYVGETVTGATAIVDTTVEARGGGVIPFQYRMARTADHWMIRDVVVDGISMVANYRAQFARVIRRSSYAEMLDLLRERSSLAVTAVAAAESPRATPPPPAPRVTSLSAAPRAASPVTAQPVAFSSPMAAEPKPVSAPTPIIATAPPPPPANSPPPHAVVTPVSRQARAPMGTTANAYWVQIGAFRNFGSAQRLIEQLGALRSAIATAADPLFRVRVGPFVDRTAAASALRQLEGRGFSAFIVETKDTLLPER
jgi:phospholipid transport system substrate-binding protein